MAKIEKPQAVERLDEIIALADAHHGGARRPRRRMPPEDVPLLQKRIVRAARARGQARGGRDADAGSMITSPAPTRAEASDVATAVFDGADAVMLSAETAAGAVPGGGRRHDGPHRRPGGAGPGLAQLIRRRARRAGAEQRRRHRRRGAAGGAHHQAQAIATFTTSGAPRCGWRANGRTADPRPDTAARDGAPAGPGLGRARRRDREDAHDIDEMVERACQKALEERVAAPGASLVITAGMPFGTPGATNLLRIAWVP